MGWVFFGLFVAGVIQALACACKREKPSNNVRIYMPPPPRTPPATRELNLPLGGSDLGGYVEHSRRTGATVQIVDKIEIANGNLTAERHLRVSQPYQAQNPLPLTCMFPAGPSARRK
jgi:hypothetical protein